MNCLSEQERIALEDIFLSISVNQSPLAKCRSFCQNYSNLLGLKEKARVIGIHTASIVRSRKNLKTYASAKLFVRTKKQKLSKHFNLKHLAHRG